MNSDSDTETWLSNWEQHCITSVDEQPNYEQLLITETDNAHRTIWASFQDSATAIAQLYKDRHSSEPSSLWAPFQTAAGSITALYKDSCDVLRNTSEVAIQCGYQKRNIELFNWAKKRRRHIKREDLLAYLAGKPVQKTNSHYHHSLSHRTSPKPRNLSPPPGVASPPSIADSELNTFREALVRSPSSRRPKGSELCAFINGEFALHCKRPASPSDVIMGSPSQHKRPKLM